MSARKAGTCGAGALRLVDVPGMPHDGAILVASAGLVLVDSMTDDERRQRLMDWAREEMESRARRSESVADRAIAAGVKTPCPPDDTPTPDWATHIEDWYHVMADSEDPKHACRPWCRSTYREFPGIASVGLWQLWNGHHATYSEPFIEFECIDKDHVTLDDVRIVARAWPEVMATMREAQVLHESAPGREGWALGEAR